jgi:hypothetical protein
LLSHESLPAYYKTNFGMMQHHKYSLEEIENMIPFEREVYVHMLVTFLEEEKKKIEQQKANHG